MTPLALTPGRHSDGAMLVTAVGEIDTSNASQLATALDATSERIVVDLTSVPYLDSAGLNVLFTHTEHIELILNPLLLPLVTLTGLADLVTVHTSPATTPEPPDNDEQSTPA